MDVWLQLEENIMKKIDHYNVLVVDDEALLRDLLVKKIKATGLDFEVTNTASNGTEAKRILYYNNIHLVITDIRMPVVDGIELADFINKEFPHIITIFLSGYADFEYARSAIRNNVMSYLLKPVVQEKLESCLCQAELQLTKYLEIEDHSNIIGKTANEIVENTEMYLKNNYMEPIDFSIYANNLGFSSSYLTKIFNKYQQTTPLKFLIRVRINEAKRLLLDTNLPIKEIGLKTGYPDQFHFSKTFRKTTGISPLEFRKTHINNNVQI